MRIHPSRSLLALSLLLFASASLQAQPFTHPESPVGLLQPQLNARGAYPAQTVRKDGLRAVILLGDDLPASFQTMATNFLRKTSSVLRERGVKVTELMNGTTRAEIAREVQGANFIIYAGHGIGSSNPPSYKANLTPGGMLVMGKVWISEKDIASWKPAPGAIVFFIGSCFSAGNSSGDWGKIDAEEATRRIAIYSSPYMKSGFAGYYAGWNTDSILARAFSGKSLGDSYDPDHARAGLTKKEDPLASGKALWYTWEMGKEGLGFHTAFVGSADRTLEQIFSGSSTETTQIDRNRLLMNAVFHSDIDTVRRLLAEGADANTVSDGWSGLLLAIYYNRLDIAKEFVEHGADMSFSIDGYNALALANGYGRSDIAAYLSEKGAIASRAMRNTKVTPKPPAR